MVGFPLVEWYTTVPVVVSIPIGGTFVKLQMSSVAGTKLYFEHSDDRITFTGNTGVIDIFLCSYAVSLFVPTATEVTIRWAKNGVLIPRRGEISQRTTVNPRAFSSFLAEGLDTGDYLELFATSVLATNLTVFEFSSIAHGLRRLS